MVGESQEYVEMKPLLALLLVLLFIPVLLACALMATVRLGLAWAVDFI